MGVTFSAIHTKHLPFLVTTYHRNNKYTLTKTFYPGAVPDIPGCPDGEDQILFPEPGSVVSAGCTVCIPEGSEITLNCTGASDSPVSYEWRDSNDQLVSSMARFTTTLADTYTCNATNIDNPTETVVTVVSCEFNCLLCIVPFTHFFFFNSDLVTVRYTSQITEQFVSQPRQDNGCSRCVSPQFGITTQIIIFEKNSV